MARVPIDVGEKKCSTSLLRNASEMGRRRDVHRLIGSGRVTSYATGGLRFQISGDKGAKRP
jgi:hypothetical protein